MSTTTAYAYIRVSTNVQEDRGSLQNQVQVIEDYVTKNDINLLAYFYETGSGKEMNQRESLKQLLLELPNVDLLLVWEQARLTRDPLDFHTIMEIVKKTQTQLITINRLLDYDDDMGEMLGAIQSHLDKMDRKRTVERMKLGIQRKKAETGRWGRPEKILVKKFEYYWIQVGIQNYTELAKLLGVSARTVSRFVKKHKYEKT